MMYRRGAVCQLFSDSSPKWKLQGQFCMVIRYDRKYDIPTVLVETGTLSKVFGVYLREIMLGSYQPSLRRGRPPAV
jgi:hypothetical protein